MIISLSSVTTSVFLSLIIVCILFFLTNYRNDHFSTSIKTLFVLSCIFLFRLVVPLEFFYTVTIPVDEMLPEIRMIFEGVLFSIGSFNVTLLLILAVIWLIGFIVRMIRLIHLVYKFDQYVKVLPQDDAYHTASVKNIFGQEVAAKVVLSPIAESPAVTGFFRPIIIFPNRMPFSDREKELIFQHELTHFKNKDTLIKLFLETFYAVYWWNPAIYIFKEQFVRIMEMRVDSRLTQQFTEQEKLEYLDCLVKAQKLSDGKKQSTKSFSIAFSANQDSALLLRAKNILGTKQFNLPKHVIGFFLLLFSIAVTSIVIEPYSVDSHTEKTTIEIQKDSENFIVKNQDGTFSLYIEGEYFSDITDPKITGEFLDWKIYDSIEEATKK